MFGFIISKHFYIPFIINKVISQICDFGVIFFILNWLIVFTLRLSCFTFSVFFIIELYFGHNKFPHLLVLILPKLLDIELLFFLHKFFIFF